VSTEGLHAYTCTLTSIRPTRTNVCGHGPRCPGGQTGLFAALDMQCQAGASRHCGAVLAVWLLSAKHRCGWVTSACGFSAQHSLPNICPGLSILDCTVLNCTVLYCCCAVLLRSLTLRPWVST
jgi:hypothetical protein